MGCGYFVRFQDYASSYAIQLTPIIPFVAAVIVFILFWRNGGVLQMPRVIPLIIALFIMSCGNRQPPCRNELIAVKSLITAVSDRSQISNMEKLIGEINPNILLADLKTDQKKSAVAAIKGINYDVYPRVTNIFIGMSQFGDIRNKPALQFSQSQCENITRSFHSQPEEATQDGAENGQLKDSLVEALEHETILSKAFKWQLVADIFRQALLADFILFIDCSDSADRQVLYTKLQELKRSPGSPLGSWAAVPDPSNASQGNQHFSVAPLSETVLQNCWDGTPSYKVVTLSRDDQRVYVGVRGGHGSIFSDVEGEPVRDVSGIPVNVGVGSQEMYFVFNRSECQESNGEFNCKTPSLDEDFGYAFIARSISSISLYKTLIFGVWVHKLELTISPSAVKVTMQGDFDNADVHTTIDFGLRHCSLDGHYGNTSFGTVSFPDELEEYLEGRL